MPKRLNYKMTEHHRHFGVLLQFLIVTFTLSLAWLSFVYYPQQLKKLGPSGVSKSVISQVSAQGGKFPIETEAFEIRYEQGSNIYYVFVNGSTVGQFAENKIAAQLALKNVLSADSLCNFTVIYAPVEKLTLPPELKSTTGC